MWKLIHWRAPLKVIIAYDWSEVEKTTDARRIWAKTKIDRLWKMLLEANESFCENPATEYLLIMAGRIEPNGRLVWWAESSGGYRVEAPLLKDN
jgi:hypothetical protein